jgi:hypothetical protein
LSFAIFLQAVLLPDMQSVVIFSGCVLFTLALVFYIFLPAPVEAGEVKTRLSYLYERKEVVYENLRDLNFEHKAGKLGDADHQGLSNSMEEEAAAVLAEIDQLEKAAGPDTAPANLPRKDKVRS